MSLEGKTNTSKEHIFEFKDKTVKYVDIEGAVSEDFPHGYVLLELEGRDNICERLFLDGVKTPDVRSGESVSGKAIKIHSKLQEGDYWRVIRMERREGNGKYINSYTHKMSEHFKQ